MKPFFCLFFLCLIAGLTAAPAVLRAQSLTARQGNGLYVSGETGEEAIAARYFEWARAAVQEKRFSQAEAFLIRAADYASVSSDLSYLLAVVKKKLFRPERDVLTAARLAMETNRWSEYSRLDALYLEAETLIRMRRYNEAVNALSVLGGGDERAAELRAAAMYWLPDEVAFETAVAEAFVRYPYSAAFPRLLFRHAAKKSIPTERERALVEEALKRLPSLLKADGELIRFAAPFIGNIEESRRLLSIWRSGELGRLSEESASGVPSAKRWTALLESLPVSLEIGLIDEETAINELFHQDSAAAESPELEREILFSVWDLLRTDEARAAMRNELSSFSGTITGDENGDGIIDSITLYDEGIVVSYSQDADQDRVNELVVAFDAGWPVNTEFTYANGTGYGGEDKILLVWDVYPALREAVWGETRYVFRPMEFNCPVTGFETLGGPGGILLPDGAADGGFSKQTFLSYAYLIERPGRDFPGGIERFECDNGVVLSSKEYLDGVLRAETAYENGQPVLQRIDLDADGRLETIRRFKRTADTILSSEIEVIESDWDGDGFAEYREAQ